MVKLVVKPVGKVVKKWVTEAPKRKDYYAEEAPAAAERWEGNTIAAKAIYKAAVTATGIDDRFAGGVKGKAPKFKRKVSTVGADRYPSGIEAAEPEYRAGMEWVIKKLSEIDVPERKPRGDPSNYKRVETIGDALHKERLARLAALGA